MGLIRRFDATLRLWINTGTVNVDVSGNASTNFYYNSKTANNTFFLYLSFMTQLMEHQLPQKIMLLVYMLQNHPQHPLPLFT